MLQSLSDLDLLSDELRQPIDRYPWWTTWNELSGSWSKAKL